MFTSLIVMIGMNYLNLCFSLQNKLIKAIIFKQTNTFHLRFLIGSPSSQWNRAINQESDISCITNSYYSPQESHLAQQIGHVNGGLIYSDIFSIDDSDMIYKNFKYIFTTNRSCLSENETGWFGFGYTNTNKSNSIAHLLYDQGKINHLSYSFTFNETTLQGALYLGGIPENATQGKYIGKCQVVSLESQWACRLTQISINDIIIENTLVSYFQAKSDFIYIPKAFMNDFINVGLRDFINNKTCTIQFRDSCRFIYCNPVNINLFPIIKLVFGDFALILTGKDYTNTFGRSAEFYIRENPKSNTWIFGCTFLKNFNSFFDYEESSVTFYSKDKIEIIYPIQSKERITSHWLINFLQIFFFIMIIIGIIIIFYWKYEINKHS